MNIKVDQSDSAEFIEPVGTPVLIMRARGLIIGNYQTWDAIKSAYELFKSARIKITLERHQILADGKFAVDSLPTPNRKGIWSPLPAWSLKRCRICTENDALFQGVLSKSDSSIPASSIPASSLPASRKATSRDNIDEIMPGP